MKKSLLLLAAAAVAVSASAQEKQSVSAPVKSDASAKVAPFACTVQKAVMATDAQRKAAKKAKAGAAVKAWYNRPAGSFYKSLSRDGGAYYNPVVFSPSWRNVTWPNASQGATAYTWSYQKYDTSAKAFVDQTSNDVDLTGSFINESEYAPSLTATAGDATDTYQLFSNYYNRTSKETTSYQGLMYYTSDPRESMMGGQNAMDCYVSPKYFSAGVREQCADLTKGGGIAYLSGAADAKGGKDGYWFGQNAAGWNATTLYVEKPATSYALRGIHVGYIADKITGATPLYAKIYEVEKDTADNLVFGDLLYTAKGTLAADAGTEGFVDMPLITVEDGMEYETVADIDEPIAVVVYGYENAAAEGFTMYISKDIEDEGYGQHGYMTPVDAEGFPKKCISLDKFFTVSLGVTAPSVFLDVEWPLMIWNYTFEDGKFNFPAAGGAWNKTVGTSKFDYISVYSTKSSEEWLTTLENGDDVPSWLHLELTDVKENDEFTGEVQIKATADALPAGTNYRQAKVEFSVPGASIVYDFSQGTPAGINDVVATGNVKAQKVVENGQVLIKVGDKKYNVMGAEVK